MKTFIKVLVLFTAVLGIALALAALFEHNNDPEYIALYNSDDLR